MTKDDATWLNICYIAFSVIVAYVANKAFFSLGAYYGWADKFDQWYPFISNISSILVGASAGILMRSSNERREYHVATIGEVRKVIWPNYPDTKKMTIVVVVVVTIFSIILTLFDILWSKALQFILP